MYVSIVVTISRFENIEVVCQQLQKIVLDDGNTYELIVALDNRKLSRFNTEVAIGRLRLPFRNITVFNTGRPVPSKFNVDQRRDRISKTLNESKEHIGGSEFVFGFEDDTILPPNAIGRLIEDWKRPDTNVGMIEGVQVGRWGPRYIGAWRVDNIEEPNRYTTVLPGNGLEPIDAGGFYCFLTYTALFKEIDHEWSDPCGPDVNFGLQLRQQGYQNYVSGSLHCGHLKEDGDVLWPDDQSVSVELYLEGGRWKDTVGEPKS